MSNVEDMKQRTIAILIYLPKIIIFGFALLNFLFIQSHLPNPPAEGAAPSFYEFYHWYEKSIIDVVLLLAASIFLLISNRISYLIAGAISGYIAVNGLFYTIRGISYFGLFELWEGIVKSESNIFLVWELQVVFAIVIFLQSFIYYKRFYV